MTYPGFFITLEGGDGCGKTTQAELLKHWLQSEADWGTEVLVTREPGGTALGLKLRQLIQHGEDMDARTEALLFAADRAHHVATMIRPALERGAIVICDRYLDSSVAYQAAGRQLSPTEVERLSLWATEGLLPDLTLLIDVSPAVAMARLSGQPDRIENAGMDFHERVRAGYLTRAAADPQRWAVIPGDGTAQEVNGAARAVIGVRLATKQTRRPGA